MADVVAASSAWVTVRPCLASPGSFFVEPGRAAGGDPDGQVAMRIHQARQEEPARQRLRITGPGLEMDLIPGR
jgi:hypothetical protein